MWYVFTHLGLHSSRSSCCLSSPLSRCTRWFLPLLLLPLPTAPPYFLVLFVVSLTLHAKPCFYCIVLLTTLSVSSCYWQPFPIDSPLTTPWSENITTFAEALNSTLPANYSKPLPTVIRAADRCWCDTGSGVFFEPFNITDWEYLSVQRLSQNLIRHKASEDNKLLQDAGAGNATQVLNLATNQTLPVLPVNQPSTQSKFWSRLRSLSSRVFASSSSSNRKVLSPKTSHENNETQSSESSPSSAPGSGTNLPLLRTVYDLRPYGLGMILDLGWSR
ncbi:hypothetical protein CVT25_005957 [Psilocybe cyanescens]|uniref:Uncharacterized protein n=1 Tax=Psilocybe cyanescens TaxID=93625 RepID=A0A409VMC9_PSICY|nr:hypothetical protein CVT25_005957 [Psilocybe cyanescens]